MQCFVFYRRKKNPYTKTGIKESDGNTTAREFVCINKNIFKFQTELEVFILYIKIIIEE